MRPKVATSYPVPPLVSMVISWVVGLLGFFGGIYLIAWGLGSVASLTCYGASAETCSISTGSGAPLVLFGIVVFVIGSIELYSAESKYEARAWLAWTLLLEQARSHSASVNAQPAPPASPGPAAPVGANSRPCPYCGAWNSRDYQYCQKCAKPLPPPL